MEIELRGQNLILDKERAIYFKNEAILAISDLHLGKAAHFRKAGIPVPKTVSQNDLQRLDKLVAHYQPKKLLINGDMFHSDYNQEIDDFARWKDQFKTLDFILVKGNHDRQDEQLYQQLGIQIHETTYCTRSFCFVHDALKCDNISLYPISGHVHPGVALYSKAKQNLKLPCFFFGNDYAILPAFSNFTGLCLVKPTPQDQVIAITPNSLIKL